MKSLTHQDPSPPARRQPAAPVRRCRRLRRAADEGQQRVAGLALQRPRRRLERLKHVGDGYNEIIDIAHKVGSAQMTAADGQRAGQDGAGQGGQQLEVVPRHRHRSGRTPAGRAGHAADGKGRRRDGGAGGRAGQGRRRRRVQARLQQPVPVGRPAGRRHRQARRAAVGRGGRGIRRGAEALRRGAVDDPGHRRGRAGAGRAGEREPDPLDHRRHRRGGQGGPDGGRRRPELAHRGRPGTTRSARCSRRSST